MPPIEPPDGSSKGMGAPITRRKLLLTGVAAAAGIAGTSGAIWTRKKGLWLGRFEEGSSGKAGETPRVFDFRVEQAAAALPVVVATGGSPSALARSALDALGGIGTFIKRGERVLIKPNVGWDRAPEMAANTNPELVKTLCEMCWNAGAAAVIVSDNTCNEMHRCFDSSGIGAAAKAAGAEVVFPRDALLKELDFNGEAIRSWPVYPHFFEVDRLINVPVAKQHSLARVTLGMKNWFGVIGGLRFRLHQSVDRCVADLATFIRPTLTVIDAYRILLRNGPQGGRVSDVKVAGTLIASVDPVSADVLAATLFDIKGEDLPYLRIAHSRGLGEIDRQRMSIRETAVAS